MKHASSVAHEVRWVAARVAFSFSSLTESELIGEVISLTASSPKPKTVATILASSPGGTKRPSHQQRAAAWLDGGTSWSARGRGNAAAVAAAANAACVAVAAAGAAGRAAKLCIKIYKFNRIESIRKCTLAASTARIVVRNVGM